MFQNENIFTPNKEIESVFIERTRYHQSLVKNNLLMMAGYLDLSKEQLLSVASLHDMSKLVQPERLGYLWMTWIFFCKKYDIKFNPSFAINDSIQQAQTHHIHTNLHHPEAHLNLEDMSSLNLVEMVCDWTAISQEMRVNQGSCLLWARNHLNKKWNFSKSKIKIIYSIINELDKRIQLSQMINNE